MAKLEGVSKNVVTIKGKKYIYWRARISRPGIFDGKRQRDFKQFKTEKEANDWLRKQAREAPRPASENLTVAEWVQPWLDGKTLKPKSRQRAEGVFRLHINPLFGDKRLDRITVDDVHSLLRSARLKGLDLNKIYMIGRSAFDDAVKRNKISFNPFVNVETPSPRKSETKTLTEDQAHTLLTTINGDPLSPLFSLTLVTGMRLGEVLGLSWDRVDLELGKIEVRQALQWLLKEHAYVDGRPHPEMLRALPYKAARDGATRPYLFTPKSENSFRDIFLDERLVKILKAHRVRQAERFGIKADGLVFVTDQGTPYRPENIERALTEYAVKANLPKGITPKGLRHSQSNFQRAMGIEAVTRAASLGHSSAVNLVTYSHASEAELRKAAELSARLIPA